MPKWKSLIVFRKERGLSIEALAQQLDLSNEYVSQIENGQDDSVASFMWKLKKVYPEIDANMLLNEKKIAWVEVTFDRKTGAIISSKPEKVEIDVNAIPKHVMDNFCRVTLKCARKAFEDPKVVAEYEKRLAEKKAKQAAGAM